MIRLTPGRLTLGRLTSGRLTPGRLTPGRLPFPVCPWQLILIVAMSMPVSSQVSAHGSDTHEIFDAQDAQDAQDGHDAGTSGSSSAADVPEPRSDALTGMASSQPIVSRVLLAPQSPTMSPAQGGSWSPVYDWPIVAVHAALLPNGKVLAWDATPDDADEDPHTTDNFTTRVTLWDPQANTHVSTNNDTDTDLFCAGSAHLWDGRILFAGGDSGKAGTNGPLSNSNLYDPATNTWRRTSNMNAPRWYSSVAALSNGELLTFGGSHENQLVAEVFSFDQSWRALENVVPTSNDGWWLETGPGSTDISYDYKWLQATPEGSVIAFGPHNLLSSLDTEGSGQWSDGLPRDQVALRDYGSYAMFDVGKILVAGGGASVASSVVIDTLTQQSSDSGNMHTGRRQHNLTILADGSVLVTGGNDNGTRFISPGAGVFTPELWDPATGQFRELNPMRADRQYHSSALLLSDGRVVSAGGGICGDCNRVGYEERNAEIYSPPYLYAADSSLAIRPALNGLAQSGNYAQTLRVSTTAGSRIQRMHIIKLGSATHSQNQDQRLVPLVFQQSGSQIDFVLPASRDVAPPGHYLLFLVDDNGVPSVGSMLKLGQPLVEPDERIVSTLLAGALDSYAFSLSAGQWSVQVSADAPIKLYLSDQPLSEPGSAASSACVADVTGSTTQQCAISIPSAGLWYLSLAGNQRTDYRVDTVFQASQAPANEGSSNPASHPQNAVESSTGRSAGSGSLAGLLILGLGVIVRQLASSFAVRFV